jgi:preprotein translocase subunit SecG
MVEIEVKVAILVLIVMVMVILVLLKKKRSSKVKRSSPGNLGLVNLSDVDSSLLERMDNFTNK